MSDKIHIALLGKDDVLAAILAEQAGASRAFTFSNAADETAAMQSDVCIMPFEQRMPESVDAQHAPLFIRIAEEGNTPAQDSNGNIVFVKPLRLAQVLDAAISSAKLRRRKQPRTLDATHVFHPFARLVEDTQHKRSVTLTEKEASFLCAVLEAGEKGLLRKDAMTELWGYHPDAESHAVDTTLYRLRQKLQECGSLDTHLINEGGIYKWRDA